MKQHILMADIIKSSSKDSNIIISIFRDIADEVNSDHRGSIYSPITITLGDEFQSVVKSLKGGIEIILDFEEHLLKYNRICKIRYVLNYGEIDTPINPDRAYQMLGRGLSHTREMLQNLKKDGNRFLIKSENALLSEKLNQAFFIYQSLVDDWKVKDYEVVLAFLNYRDYKIVAKNLNRDTSSMWRKEKSLKIKEYLAAKDILFFLLNRD
jgi:hypothetical protein